MQKMVTKCISNGEKMAWSKKKVVEEAFNLDIHQWNRLGKLQPDTVRCGNLVWSYTRGWQAEMGYEVSTVDMKNPFIRLSYSWREEETEEYQPVDYCIPLATTYPPFGGVRWWFRCPLLVGKRPCEKKVTRLYMPRGCHYFGCRHCYRLTYTSCQENHQFEAYWREQALGTEFTWRELRKFVTPEKTELLPEFR